MFWDTQRKTELDRSVDLLEHPKAAIPEHNQSIRDNVGNPKV